MKNGTRRFLSLFHGKNQLGANIFVKLVEMKHFKLKSREKIKAMALQRFVKKARTEQWLENLVIGELPEEDWVRKSNDLRIDTPYLM